MLELARPLGTGTAPLRHALFHYSAADVLAQEPYPVHNLAEERGYALNYEALAKYRDRNEPASFKFGGNLGGQRTFERRVSAGQAVFVDAGTLLPETLDVVVPEDEVERKDNEIVVKTRPERFGGVIRRGRFIREQDVLLSRGRRIDDPGFAALYSQAADEVEVTGRPTTGSLILGSGLHDPYTGKGPKDPTPELLSPIVAGICARRQLPFISLGIQEAHKRVDEAVLHASGQAEVVVASGILSSAQWQDFEAALENDWELQLKGLSHPLCGRLRVAAREGRWLFFLPYHPPLIQALFALLIYPFVTRMAGDQEGTVPVVSAKLLESAEVKNPEDDIWIGRERPSSEFVNTAEVSLICQISGATLTSLVEGTCFAFPRMAGDRLDAGSEVAIIRF